MTQKRKMLITMIAAISIAILGFAVPASASAAGLGNASGPHPVRTANVWLGRAGAASPDAGGCIGHVQVQPNSTSWAAVTASAWPYDCVDVVACYSQVDLQTESKLTSGWSNVAEAPQKEGCSESGASIVSEPCAKASFSWTYRAVGYFTIYFSNGGVTSGSTVTNSISHDSLCGPGELEVDSAQCGQPLRE